MSMSASTLSSQAQSCVEKMHTASASNGVQPSPDTPPMRKSSMSPDLSSRFWSTSVRVAFSRGCRGALPSSTTCFASFLPEVWLSGLQGCIPPWACGLHLVCCHQSEKGSWSTVARFVLGRGGGGGGTAVLHHLSRLLPASSTCSKCKFASE